MDCFRLNIFCFLILVLLGFSAPCLSLDFSYSGRITESSGKPIDGPVNLSISFYRAESGGSSIIAPIAFSDIALTEGTFTVTFNDQKISATNLNIIFSSSEPVWIEVTDSSNSVVYPRQKMGAVPFALKVPADETTLTYDTTGKMKLKNVNNLQGHAVSNVDPTDNYVLKWTGGAWTPSAVTADSGGDMLASVYDTSGTIGIVDNAEALGGQTGNYYRDASNINAGTLNEARLANAANWNTAYGWGNHASAGYVTGPGSSTANGIPKFSGTGGKTLIDSGVVIDGSGNVGIGVSPSAKLDVNGTLNIRDANEVRFSDADSSNYVGFKAPSSVTSNKIFSLPNGDGSSGQFLKTDGSGALGWGSVSSIGYIQIVDEEAQGTDVSSTSGSWQTRAFNTEKVDTASRASISGNVITLLTGTYLCTIHAVIVCSSQSRSRLVDADTSTVLASGLSTWNYEDYDCMDTTDSPISAYLSLSSTTNLRVESRVAVSRPNGFGRATNFGGPELYSTFECLVIQ